MGQESVEMMDEAEGSHICMLRFLLYLFSPVIRCDLDG